MAITAAQLGWYYTVEGGRIAQPSALGSRGGHVSLTRIRNNAISNVFGGLTSTQNKAGVTDYRCIALLNSSALTLSSPKVYLYRIDTRGATFSIGLDPAGIVTTPDTAQVATSTSTGTTAPAGVTFSIPTSAAPISLAGALAPGAAFAVWLRRVVSNVAGVNPETNIIAVAGTSPI